MKLRHALAGIALATLAPHAAAQAYKCVLDGKTTYQDRPCAPGAGNSTQLDLDGVFDPPGTGAGPRDLRPERLASNVAFMRELVQHCQVGAAGVARFEQQAAGMAPRMSALTPQQRSAAAADGSQRAKQALVSPPGRQLACAMVHGLFESSPATGPGAPPARTQPTPPPATNGRPVPTL